MEPADEELEKAKTRLIEEVIMQRQSIATAAVQEEHVWFRNLLVAIFNSTLEDYKSVEIGAKKFVPLAAWGRRNLLELRVITDFVLASEANARMFQTDLLIDAKELHDALSKDHAATHKRYVAELAAYVDTLSGPRRDGFETALQVERQKGPNTSSTDSEAQMFKGFLEEMGVNPKVTPKRTGEIAKLIGQKEDFEPMFKICSKLMHRTALSIASTNQHGSLDEIAPSLLSSAFSDVIAISNSIKFHIDTVGIQPK